jgi:membrane associated rhomboid family serine protease
MRWKINRYKMELEERMERARGFFQSVVNKQRMCPACRALIDRKERTCPLCGERVSEVSQAGLGRALDSILPQQARYTTILLSVNVFLFGLMLLATIRARGGEFSGNLLFGGIDVLTLVRFGAKYGFLIADGEWWRFVTPIFLHANLIHIAFNSWVLFDLGPAVEGLYGPQKFLVLYITTGAASFVTSFLWNPNVPSVGASGAIFGLIGVMIAYGYRNRRGAGEAVRNMFVRWAVYMLLFGLIVPGIDNAAHIGGLVSGIAFGALVPDLPELSQTGIQMWKLLRSVAVLVVLFGFIMVGLRAGAIQ